MQRCGVKTGKTLLSALLLALTGCLVPEHQSLDTPLETVLSFQSAYARGEDIAEYRCLSTGLAQRIGGVRGFSLFHEQLSPGFLARFVLRHNSLEDNLAAEEAAGDARQLWFEVLGQTLGIELIPEWLVVFETAAEDPVGASTFGDWRLRLQEGKPHLEIPLQLSRLEARKLQAATLRGVALQRQWKIHGLMQPPIPETARPPSGAREEDVPEAAPTPVERWILEFGRSSYTGTDLILALPLDARQVENLRQFGLPVRDGRHRWQIQK